MEAIGKRLQKLYKKFNLSNLGNCLLLIYYKILLVTFVYAINKHYYVLTGLIA